MTRMNSKYSASGLSNICDARRSLRASRRRGAAVLAMAAASAVGATALTRSAPGATLYWDPGTTNTTTGGGAGTWNTSGLSNWDVSGSGDTSWTDTTGVNTAVFGGTTAGTVTLSGTDVANALDFTTTGYTLTGGTLTLAGSTPVITVNSSESATIASTIVGTTAFTVNGGGTLTLSGTNSSFTGGTTISAGTLNLTNISAAGTGTITLNDGNTGSSNTTLLMNVGGSTVSWGNAITVASGSSGTATIKYVPASGGFTWTTGTITLNSPATITAPSITSYCQFGSVLTGSGTLTIGSTNGQRFILTGTASGFTGNIIVASGALFEPRSVLSSSAGNNVTLNTGGIMNVDSGTTSIDALSGSGTVEAYALGSGTLSVGNNNATGSFGGVLENYQYTLSLTKAGSGTQTLAGADTYTGATTVNGGTLQAGVTSVGGTSGAFGLNSAIVMSNTAGATLDLNGYNTQIGSLTGGGTTGGNVTLEAATLTIGGDNTSPAAYAGVISSTGSPTTSLIKIGTGTLTLSGVNTYAGGTGRPLALAIKS